MYAMLSEGLYNYINDEIFFAFSKERYEIGSSNMPHGETIYSGGSGTGMYGTKKGFDTYIKHIESVENRIRKECTPEEIYEYEYDNHECGYTGDDSEAIEIVRHYFPEYRREVV